jgi:hypothetical protein
VAFHDPALTALVDDWWDEMLAQGTVLFATAGFVTDMLFRHAIDGVT